MDLKYPEILVQKNVKCTSDKTCKLYCQNIFYPVRKKCGIGVCERENREVSICKNV